MITSGADFGEKLTGLRPVHPDACHGICYQPRVEPALTERLLNRPLRPGGFSVRALEAWWALWQEVGRRVAEGSLDHE